jgi:hypothetical protein
MIAYHLFVRFCQILLVHLKMILTVVVSICCFDTVDTYNSKNMNGIINPSMGGIGNRCHPNR